MKLVRKSALPLSALFALSFCAGPVASFAQQAPASLAELRAGFLNPPPQARLRCYWWWLNGNTDKATITHDLEEMKAKGFGGALLVDANGSEQLGNHAVPAGPKFGSPAWTALFTHALAEADRLGLEITLNITSGWNLGGPGVKPEQASKVLTYSRVIVSGGRGLARSSAATCKPQRLLSAGCAAGLSAGTRLRTGRAAGQRFCRAYDPFAHRGD